MTEFVQVVTTVASEEDAREIVRAVVSQRLAACGQVGGPIHSTYWWQGELESSQEWLCILKSSRERTAALIEQLRNVHPYDVPEILAVPVTDGNPDYLNWLRSELRPLPDED